MPSWDPGLPAWADAVIIILAIVTVGGSGIWIALIGRRVKAVQEQTVNEHADAEYPNLRDELSATLAEVRGLRQDVGGLHTETRGLRADVSEIRREASEDRRDLTILRREREEATAELRLTITDDTLPRAVKQEMDEHLRKHHSKEPS